MTCIRVANSRERRIGDEVEIGAEEAPAGALQNRIQASDADHVTIWRWVQRYAPEIQRRLRPRLRPTNDSWRVDETYIRVKGKWVYLYRAVDSTGATTDFLLSAKRDTGATKRFLAKALGGANHSHPRVINTDKDAAYPPAIIQLKAKGDQEENCGHRPVQYLNNGLEQDHRAIKRRIRASQHFRSFWGAWRSRRYVLVVFADRHAGLLSHADGSGLFPEPRSKLTALSWEEIRLALMLEISSN